MRVITNKVPLDKGKPNSKLIKAYKLHIKSHPYEWMCAFINSCRILNSNIIFHIAQCTT